MGESVSAQLTIWSVLSVIKDICREILKALLIWLLDEQDRRPQGEVGAEQGRRAIDDAWIGDDVGEERKGEVRVVAVLGMEVLGECRLGRLEIGEQTGRLVLGHHVDRGDPPVLEVVVELVWGEAHGRRVSRKMADECERW